MKKDGVKANFIYNLIYNIVNIIVPLVTAPYTARVLGAENIGIYSYTYAIVSSVVMFGALGTATYGQKEIASAGENIVERSEKFLEIWVLKAVTMVIAFLIFVPYAYQTTAWIYYALQIPYIVAGVFDISFFFQGIEKFRYIAVRNTIVRIAGIVLLFSLVKSSNDLWIYLLIISVSQLLGNLSMWPYLRGNICRVKLTTRNVMKHLSNVMIYFIPSITYQIYAVLDKAMLGWLVGSNYENGYYDDMVLLLRNMFGNVLKSNDSLAFAVLTGCLRIAKESIFTGLNNFKVYSITDQEFDETFGFTDAEVKAMLQYYGLQDYFSVVREWYDGYRFGKADVYCPWDVVNYCSDHRKNVWKWYLLCTEQFEKLGLHKRRVLDERNE